MSYYLSVLKDSPIGLWKLDELSGQVAYDVSGCGNHASYIGQISKLGMPIVSGGDHSNKIDSANYIQFTMSKDFSGTIGTGGLATFDTYDNDFSLEAWIHPKTITSLTPILADSSGIGLYWDNGNVVFQLESERIDYSVPNPNRAIHIVGVYSVNSMSLYVNGVLVSTKAISIKFTNTDVSLLSGPALPGEYFLIDSPAVYRYSLSQSSILSHYNNLFLNNDEQVSLPDLGELFKAGEKYQEIETRYVYPAQVAWDTLIYDNDALSYSKNNNSIYLNSGFTSGEFVEDMVLNITKNYASSKIDWVASNGVSVYVSETSESGPWTPCVNGSSIPGFTQGSNFSPTKILYFKFVFTSTNSDVYLPELYSLKIYFYSTKKMLGHSGGSTLSISEPTVGSVWDIDIANDSYPIRLREGKNGVRPKSSAFYIKAISENRNIEMIFTPKSLSNGHLLFNKTGLIETELSWAAGGVITKSNISNIYINGQDASSATNISSYLYIDEPNYILIKTSTAITGEIWFNGKQLLGVRSSVLDDNLYQNIALYANPSISHQEHYDLYIGKSASIAEGSSMSLTEESVATYSRDRVVLQII
jgi:hypothetical protein